MLKKRFFKTKNEADITFEFVHSVTEPLIHIDKVELVAEFNNWQPINMKYVKKDNIYRAKVRLPVGQQFHYRYLVNNQEWHNDHDADLYQPNEYGSDNSVVSTANKS